MKKILFSTLFFSLFLLTSCSEKNFGPEHQCNDPELGPYEKCCCECVHRSKDKKEYDECIIENECKKEDS